MSSLSIGVSALQVNQRLLDLSGQNIANASTPDYHRQVADLSERIVGAQTGAGVAIKNVTRVVSQLLEDAVVRNTSASNKASTLNDGLTQLQSILAPGEGSLNDMLQSFFNEAERLSTQPNDITQRRVVLAAANDLADRFNATNDNFATLRGGLGDQAQVFITSVNSLTAQIARLNSLIHDAAATGEATNGMFDQRDHALAQLSELVDVRTVPQELGQINVLVAGTPVILNSDSVPLHISTDSQGQLVVLAPNSKQALDVTGGKLAGTLALYNTIIPAVRGEFDQLAHSFVSQIDGIHATGLGLDGPLTSLTSQRLVANTNQPLTAAKLDFPPRAGDLYITVTEFATGQRSLQRVAVDPSQNLGNLATAISAIPNMQAVVDAQAGTLNLIARPGFGFDFTGNLSTVPDAQTLTGTSTANISGQYTGTTNGQLDFRVVGTGAVGSSANLALEVRNSAGTLISTLNIGQGYEAGANLPDVLGVKVSMANGAVNNGDSFQVNVAADPDSAGILTALGLNTFFVGGDSSSLHVRTDLLDHPERFAVSQSGQPGDGANLYKLVGLRDQNTMDNQRQTFDQFLANLIGDVGIQVQDASTRASAYESLGVQLDDQRQSISGVDTNEELIRLVQYQHAYQMSARFIAVVNATLDEVLRLA